MFCVQLAEQFLKEAQTATERAELERRLQRGHLNFSPAYREALERKAAVLARMKGFTGCVLVQGEGGPALLGQFCQNRALLTGWRNLPYDTTRFYCRVMPTERAQTRLHRQLFPASWRGA